jgi:hypothetical protein
LIGAVHKCKRQRALAFTVIRSKAHSQEQHSCSRLAWRPTWKTWSGVEVRRDISFLWTQAVLAADIHRLLSDVYDHDGQATGCQLPSGDNRTGRGSPSKTEVNAAHFEELIHTTDVYLCHVRHVTLVYPTALCSISCWMPYSVLRSVPRALTDDNKAARIIACLSFLQRYAVNRKPSCAERVASHETWVRHFTHTSKLSALSGNTTAHPERKVYSDTIC